MKTKIIVVVLFFIAILLPSIIMPFISFNVDIWLNKMDIDAVVSSDGTLKVVEKWEAQAGSNAGYTNLFKEITLFNSQTNRYSDFKVVRVTDSDGTVYSDAGKINTGADTIDEYDLRNVQDGQYYTAYPYSGKTIEFGLKMPTELRNAKRSFTLEYEILDFATKYNDCTEINWKILDNFSVDIKEFYLNLSFEDGNIADAFNRVYLHNTNPSSLLEFNDNQIEVSAKKLERKEMLEVRGVYDNAYFSNISEGLVLKSNIYNEVVAEEQAQAEAYASKVKRQSTLYIIGIVLAVLSVTCAIAGSIFATIWIKKPRKEYPKYVRDVPKDISVGGAGSLFYYYKGGLNNSKNFSNVIAGYLLELANKGYIDFEGEDKNVKIKVKTLDEMQKQKGYEPPKPKTAEEIFGEDFNGVKDSVNESGVLNDKTEEIFGDNFEGTSHSNAKTLEDFADDIKSFINNWCGEDIFSDKSKENMDAVFKEKYGELKDEYDFYKLLLSVQEFYNSAFTMKQFIAYAKTKPVAYESKMNAIRRNMDLASKTELGWGKQFSIVLTIQIIFTVLCFAMAYLSGYLLVGIISLLALLIGVLFTPKYKKLSAEREAKQEEIIGLYRFLNDFSALDEKDLKYFSLWEEYMVYATMFGIADKVVAQLKVKCPEVYQKMSVVPIYHMFFINRMLGVNSMQLSSFASSMVSTAKVVKTINASKVIAGSIKGGHGRGGGGFGGGGKGFGGGGGGFR